MKKFETLEEYLIRESSADLNLPKNKWVEITKKDVKNYPELEDEFFELIKTAYAEIGGHVKVKSPSDVFKDPDWNYWEVIDVDDDPLADVVIIGSKTKYGVKSVGVGHDGEKLSKKVYLDGRADNLKQNGFYAEISGKLAEILLNKYKVPFVNDKEDVAKVLGKEVKWIGEDPESNTKADGWYERTIGGHLHKKILLGKPKV